VISRSARRLTKPFYARDALAVARDLIGCLFVHETESGRVGVRLVEAEAYRGPIDPGSHGYGGMTRRTRTMFGPPGRLYVYFTYGMHWCTNVVCGPDGEAGAVLLRALAPLDGLDVMWSRRPKARRERDLCSGPARLAQALGLDRAADGADLVAGPIQLVDDGMPPPVAPGVSTRIGLAPGRGDQSPWRFYVPGESNISRPPRT
jgi:DNA-3-methyladenine glycosylase